MILIFKPLSIVGITILAPDDSRRSDIQNRVTIPSANPPVVQPTVETADGANAVLPSVEILVVVKVADWRTGTYTVRMRHGLLKDVKRFVVIH
ncbi:MAG: hypothetical protein RL329_3004 [Bacteroidota bacterium]|jgi:hypothetical protein